MKKIVLFLLISVFIGGAWLAHAANTPARVIVKYKNGTTSNVFSAKHARTLNHRVVRNLKKLNTDVVAVPSGSTLQKTLEAYRNNPDVEYVEPDYLVYPAAVPNDPHYNNSGLWWLRTIRAAEAWDHVTGNDEIIVAVCDSGIQSNHPDLTANLILPGYNSADGTTNSEPAYNHGTAVAGIIGAVGNNNLGTVGINWRIKILPIRITNNTDTGTAQMSDILEAIRYAADNGAKVINVSYGPLASFSADDAARYAREKGALTFVSAGNSATEVSTAYSNILVVSATDDTNARAGFSNYGNAIDLAAPGVGMFTTQGGSSYGGSSGTSFASPAAAGVAALIYSVNPSFTPNQVENFLISSTVDLGAPGKDQYFGHGLMDALGAVQLALGITTPTNRAPNVNAGNNLSILLPSHVFLNGVATDDGLPNNVLTTQWSKESGPGLVTFNNAAALNAEAVFSLAGAYVLKLTATDGVFTSADTITVTVGPARSNQAPQVNAGTDQIITLSNLAQLSGQASDDKLPNPPAALTITWSKQSGPGTVLFNDSSSLETGASFSAVGLYVLKLTAFDGELSSDDTLNVTVNPTPPTNQTPAVNAGNNQSVALSNPALLTGIASDDGLPNPPGALTITWSKQSGPGTVTFANAASLNTSAVFSSAGQYILKLTVSDGLLFADDTITINVGVGSVPTLNQPPAVNAGTDQTISFPNLAVLSGTATDDGYPTPPGTLAVMWSKISGAGLVTFTDQTALQTNAAFSTAGDYALKLTATDGALQSEDIMVVHVLSLLPNNNPPEVTAGPDQTVLLTEPLRLTGLVSDDGLPNNTLETEWKALKEPGPVNIMTPQSQTTDVLIDVAGLYQFQLTAFDGELSQSDTVSIMVINDAANAAAPATTDKNIFYPRREEITLSCTSEVKIFTHQGWLVTTLSCHDGIARWNGQVDSSLIASGMYLAKQSGKKPRKIIVLK